MVSGDSYKSVGYRLEDRTVSKIVKDTSTAIWNAMQPLYLPQRTRVTWIASDFKSRWHFPHCLGAVDGKHILIKNPNKPESSYLNYKHKFLILIMAYVDAKYRFTFIDVGSMGRFSGGNFF